MHGPIQWLLTTVVIIVPDKLGLINSLQASTDVVCSSNEEIYNQKVG